MVLQENGWTIFFCFSLSDQSFIFSTEIATFFLPCLAEQVNVNCSDSLWKKSSHTQDIIIPTLIATIKVFNFIFHL